MKLKIGITLLLLAGCGRLDQAASAHQATGYSDGIAAYEMGDGVRCYVLRNSHLSCVTIGQRANSN